MNKKTVQSLIEIAKTHESQLLYALNNLAYMFPVSKEKVVNFTQQ